MFTAILLLTIKNRNNPNDQEVNKLSFIYTILFSKEKKVDYSNTQCKLTSK